MKIQKWILAALFICVFTGFNQETKACNLTSMIFDSIRADTGGHYVSYFRSCIGGGATDTIGGTLFGADQTTINIMYMVWPNTARIVHTHSNPYRKRIPSPMPASCTNCQRIKSYGGQIGVYADPADTDGFDPCPISDPSGVDCDNAFLGDPTVHSIGGCLWYTANDSTNQCWGDACGSVYAGAGAPCTNFCCSTIFTGTKSRPAFVDIWKGVGAKAAYCFSMYIRTLGYPDSIEMQNPENANTYVNYCRGQPDGGLDEDIRFTSMTFPVQFRYFNVEGDVISKNVSLNWGTAIEGNTESFLVMKSVDGSNFFPIGSVMANGNQKEKYDYAFQDLYPVSGNNYYKLVEFGKDFASSESQVEIVNFTGNIQSHINYISPVPTQDKATVSFYAAETKSYSVSIYDIKGQLVKEFAYEAHGGENKLEADLSHEENGIYFIHFNGGKDKFAGKLVKSF